MTKKIFRAVFMVAAAVLLACFIIIIDVLYSYFTTVQQEQLQAQTALVAQGVETEGADYLAGLELYGYRLTWIAADGTVLYDSDADLLQMENHAGREEILQALDTGSGFSTRFSATLAQKTIYQAQRLSDGSVLRVAVVQDTVLSLVMGMMQPVLLVLVIALLLSAVLARRLSRRIVEPLNQLDLDHPLENNAYEELSPLLIRIERQHLQIDNQLRELRLKQEEFSIITENMNEGLVLLGDRGQVLSINRAALLLFDVTEACLGSYFLFMPAGCDLQAAVEAALRDGSCMSENINHGGRKYMIEVNPIFSADSVSGAVLLCYDITEKDFAEQQRREFTANVSHELKTPLQSIMGSAELIANGMVQQEDMPRFINRISSEAARLVTLIDDIISLAQLDEGEKLNNEPVDLYLLAVETADILAEAAASCQVDITVQGGTAQVYGVRRLLSEIIYNLSENAVKYNRAGGRVEICVERQDNGSLLRVSDTGIGIPPEHQERVFERFYRVDKSHSRATGGTGLGLSIVKHAALYHQAEISLYSTVGQGTTVLVFFPDHTHEL